MSHEILFDIGLVGLCLFLGGLLKGAIGAGAPLFAVPAMAILFDVRFAVVVMMVPNLLTNTWQAWQYRAELTDRAFLVPFVGGGLVGVAVGTWLLATLPLALLPPALAATVFGYIALRFARPDWVLSLPLARRLALPVGSVAGVLQGATGISAPVSITFLNAMRLTRPRFIGTVSLYFGGFTLVQLPALWFGGVAKPYELLISAAALAPIMAGMPVGAALARRLPQGVFDRIILAALAVIALRLAADYFLTG